MSLEVRRRLGLPRMYFHVMNRGARQVSIFAGAQDRRLFVGLMGDFALKYGVRIISWALMPNHYHVEPDTEGTPLSRMMHDLDGTYAQIFNERHGKTGCLFEAPFKSMRVVDEYGLVYVSRYIHTNCVSLSIAPQDYEWSSCRSYLGLAPVPGWLNPQPVLSVLENQTGLPGPVAYSQYLSETPPRRPKSKVALDEQDDFYIEYLRYLEEWACDIVLTLGADLGRVAPRTVVAWAALRIHGIPARLVSDFFGYSDEACVHTIAGRFQERLDGQQGLQEKVLRKRRRAFLNSLATKR